MKGSGEGSKSFDVIQSEHLNLMIRYIHRSVTTHRDHGIAILQKTDLKFHY